MSCILNYTHTHTHTHTRARAYIYIYIYKRTCKIVTIIAVSYQSELCTVIYIYIYIYITCAIQTTLLYSFQFLCNYAAHLLLPHISLTLHFSVSLYQPLACLSVL